MASSRSLLRGLPDPVLMLVTRRSVASHDGSPDRLVDAIDQAIDGGVNVVQLRENDLPAAELLELGRRLRGVCSGRALMLVNDRLDMALLCGADGVHLPENGLPTAPVRALAPPSLLVGRSVHGINPARAAEMDGVDYLLAGTIFPSETHPEQPAAGVEFLLSLASRVRTPVLAVGGIDAARARECRRAGVRGVAVIRSILAAASPRSAAEDLWAALQEEPV